MTDDRLIVSGAKVNAEDDVKRARDYPLRPLAAC